MRQALVDKLADQGRAGRTSRFCAEAQRGMFSYSGLNSAQVDLLRNEHGIYAVGTGRICVAALNSRNIDAVVDAIAAVL
ncbi:aminotransferase class I/II-fold pyridoxal phosphate-dependent enzyme [Cupriavidus basilensis]